MARCYWRGSHYLEWLLDRQDVMIHRVGDLKILGSEEEYQKVMIFFAEVIQALGKSLEVRQQVIATATVYFKRFYGRNSLKTIDPWLMAPSCVFLASKVEEFGVLSQKSLLTACRNLVHSHYSVYFPDSHGYPFRAQDMLECEFILLEAMDCSLIVYHPYRPLVQYCEELRPHLHELADLLLERAWWLVNDSYRTDVCLLYPPYIIALGCLQTAFVILANNTELLSTAAGSNSHSSGSSGIGGRHTGGSSFGVGGAGGGGGSLGSGGGGYFPHHSQNQLSVEPLAVAENWFSELSVDMEKVLEVTRQLLSLYDLWRRYDEASEMPTLLLKRIPRPVIAAPTTSTTATASSSSTTTSTGVVVGCGVSAMSISGQQQGSSSSNIIYQQQQASAVDSSGHQLMPGGSQLMASSNQFDHHQQQHHQQQQRLPQGCMPGQQTGHMVGR